MAKTPRITIPAGSDVAIVEITGNPRNQEPAHVRLAFPGGEVEVVRSSDGPDAEYWVHIHVHQRDSEAVKLFYKAPGQLVDARLDIKGKHASESNAGDFADPGLYHLAVRVARQPGGGQ